VAAAARVLTKWAPSAESGYRALVWAEQSALVINHAVMGAQLADHWNLSPGVSAAIRYLSEPDRCCRRAAGHGSRVIATADSMADLFGGVPVAALQRYRKYDKWFSVTEVETELVIGATDETVDSMWRLLDVSTDEIPSVTSILSRANEVLTRTNLQVTQESVRLASENVTFVNDSLTDPLTGLANRRQLDQFLGEQSRITQRYAGWVRLLMIVLDHFKVVNDTHGHPVGDLVRQAVASSLRGLMRKSDLVARYVGEEFVVVIPATDLGEACVVAERARIVIRDAEVLSADGIAISVTASVGVTSLDRKLLEEPDAMLARADAAVYLAKDGGRDRIATLPLDEAA
jgi:diguanylate cyclase (GGDEF)-like protein